MFILTKLNEIDQVVIGSNGFDYSNNNDFAGHIIMTFNNGVRDQIAVFHSGKIPQGFESQVQAVPLEKFIIEAIKAGCSVELKPELLQY